MKRSRVNEIIKEADAFIRSFGYVMPPFAYWSPANAERRGVTGSVSWSTIRSKALSTTAR